MATAACAAKRRQQHCCLLEGFFLLAPLACLTLESPQVTTTAGYCAAKRRQHWCLKTYCWLYIAISRTYKIWLIIKSLSRMFAEKKTFFPPLYLPTTAGRCATKRCQHCERKTDSWPLVYLAIPKTWTFGILLPILCQVFFFFWPWWFSQEKWVNGITFFTFLLII